MKRIATSFSCKITRTGCVFLERLVVVTLCSSCKLTKCLVNIQLAEDYAALEDSIDEKVQRIGELEALLEAKVQTIRQVEQECEEAAEVLFRRQRQCDQIGNGANYFFNTFCTILRLNNSISLSFEPNMRNYKMFTKW